MATPRGRPVKLPVSQRITNALDIGSELLEENPKFLSPNFEIPKIESSDIQDDYLYVRNNLHTLLDQGNELLSGITELARDCDKPSAYEAAGILLKVLIEGNRELMTLQKDIKDLEKKTRLASEDLKPTVSIQHADQVTHVVLEGTTMEMLDIIEAAKEQKKQRELAGDIHNG